MRLVFRILLLLLTAGLGFSLGMHVISLRADRENGFAQARDLRTRLNQLLSKEKALRNEGTRLNAELAAMSARVTAAETRYTEERATNEPLRRQVEQMMGRQIANATELARQAGDLKTAQEALATASERHGKLADENEALKKTIQGLEATARDKTAALTEMQARLTALEKTQAETRTSLAAAEAALAAAKQKNVELAAALEALRKPDGAANPVPAPGR